MLHGVIIVPVSDLRDRPDSGSERINQALFGTPVFIEKTQREFSYIKMPDGYKGWCRTPHIDQVAFARWKKYADKPKFRIKVEVAKVKHDKSESPDPYRLYFGTEINLMRHGDKTRFTLPNGYRGLISKSVLAEPIGKKKQAVSAGEILKTARKFLGVPYLWGGITPAGFDCSGLMQIVYGFHGVRLPRDSSHQRKEGFSIKRGEIRPGDLLFFPGHVAIAAGKGKIIHASATRGMVLQESLTPGDDDYREDLDNKFELGRRIQL